VRAADDLDISKLERTADAAPTADPFAPKNFNPQQQAAPVAQAKPEAPALPFRYIGKVLDGDKLSVFLARGDESFSVRAGEKIDDYRIDKVTDSEITFTYLPLKTRQSLPL